MGKTVGVIGAGMVGITAPSFLQRHDVDPFSARRFA